jgi:hypothetical protein
MSIERKRIDMKAAAQILEKLEDSAEEDTDVSLGRFVAVNFEALSRFVSYPGKNIRHIYEHLKAGGLDVGTYHSFRSACYRAGLRRRTKKSAFSLQELVNDVKTPTERQEAPKTKNMTRTAEERRAEKSKYNPALPPVFLPGGIEAIIDPETGAKCFEIKARKESE